MKVLTVYQLSKRQLNELNNSVGTLQKKWPEMLEHLGPRSARQLRRCARTRVCSHEVSPKSMLPSSIAGDAYASERDIMSRTTHDGGGAMPPSENLCRLRQPLTCGHPSEHLKSLFFYDNPPPASRLADCIRLHSGVFSLHNPSQKSLVEIVARRGI